MNEPLTYLSTFTGIGGFELGIQDAVRKAQRRSAGDPQSQPGPGQGLQSTQGQDTSASSRRPGANDTNSADDGSLCVGYSEVDAPAIRTYERHFKHRAFGDIKEIDPAELPDFRLLVGGFPCQSFSIAGKRRGFSDIRGTLFFDVARILQHKRPRHLVLENVKGLLTHDGGETIQEIFRVLADMGYRAEWMVLNSSGFGVPQNRERIYIVGHRRGECSGQVLPITSSHCETSHPDPAGVVGIRRLTPLECERLQGFPDDWTVGQTDTQRYKQCGNAVTVNVVSAVVGSMLERCEL